MSLVYIAEPEHKIPEKSHGKWSGYQIWGCRCELCSAFQREYKSKVLARYRTTSKHPRRREEDATNT